MRLSDFIDFISVEREREDRHELLTTLSRLYRIPLSQLETSDGGAIVYCSAVSANVGGRNRINLRIR